MLRPRQPFLPILLKDLLLAGDFRTPHGRVATLDILAADSPHLLLIRSAITLAQKVSALSLERV